MAEGKTFGSWVSGDLLTKAEQRCKDVAAGNTSAYVKELIRRDVEDVPELDDTLIARLARISHGMKLAPSAIMQAVMAEVVDHADAHGGRLEFPVRLFPADEEARQGAAIWAQLDQDTRDALLAHARKGDTWADVLDAMKSDTPDRLHDLRLAYQFATPHAAGEKLGYAAESGGPKSFDEAKVKARRLADQARANAKAPTPKQ